MPKQVFPAAAEGMPIFNRRALLQGIGATAAVVGTAVSAVAAAASPVAEAVAAEHPWEKARRLGRELAEVLAADAGDGFSPSGQWFAEVYPTSDRGYDVMFGNIEARNWPRMHVSLPFQQVIDAHKEARAAFEAVCPEVDHVAIGREPSKAAWRRWRRAEKAEDAALTAVCAFRPHGRADATAKAGYLRKYVEWGELTKDQIMALVYAGVQQ